MGHQKELNDLLLSRKPEIVSGFPDNIKFRDLKIAGLANSLESGFELQEQLLQGFRLFEINLIDDNLMCLNGRRFEDLLKQFNQYFILHPREAIFVSINCSFVRFPSMLLDKLYSLGMTSFYNVEENLGNLRGKVWLLRMSGCTLLKGSKPSKEYSSFDSALTDYERIVSEKFRWFNVCGSFKRFSLRKQRALFDEAFTKEYGYKYSGIYIFQNPDTFISNSDEFSYK